MSYPAAVATGNRLIAAALAWDDACTAWGSACFAGHGEDEAEAAFFSAQDSLDDAIAAHREAIAALQPQGPDIDAPA